jgi:hypothetical protein
VEKANHDRRTEHAKHADCSRFAYEKQANFLAALQAAVAAAGPAGCSGSTETIRHRAQYAVAVEASVVDATKDSRSPIVFATAAAGSLAAADDELVFFLYATGDDPLTATPTHCGLIVLLCDSPQMYAAVQMGVSGTPAAGMLLTEQSGPSTAYTGATEPFDANDAGNVRVWSATVTADDHGYLRASLAAEVHGASVTATADESLKVGRKPKRKPRPEPAESQAEWWLAGLRQDQKEALSKASSVRVKSESAAYRARAKDLLGAAPQGATGAGAGKDTRKASASVPERKYAGIVRTSRWAAYLSSESTRRRPAGGPNNFEMFSNVLGCFGISWPLAFPIAQAQKHRSQNIPKHSKTFRNISKLFGSPAGRAPGRPRRGIRRTENTTLGRLGRSRGTAPAEANAEGKAGQLPAQRRPRQQDDAGGPGPRRGPRGHRGS